MNIHIGDPVHSEIHELCEAVLDGSLTESQLQRLEELVKGNHELRRYYVRYIRQHLLLLERQRPFHSIETALPKAGIFHLRATTSLTMKFYLAVAMILLLVTGSIFLVFQDTFRERDSVQNSHISVCSDTPGSSEVSPPAMEEFREDDTFGSLQVMANCTWADPESVINNGERVGRRLIHLLEGIVQIRYDNGVSLNIEGPAKIELSQYDRCFLHFGNVLAQVSPSGIGFTIDTCSASIEDRGTEFGVEVSDEKNSEVRVFSGHVEVRPIGEQTSIPLTTGRRIRFTDTQSTHLFNDFSRSDTDQDIVSSANHVYACNTADGFGKEACVISGGKFEALSPDLISKSETLTLVKNASPLTSRWHRKAYFSIDVGNVPISAFSDVVLELAFARTGVGFESRSASYSLLSVYGLLDESDDFWKEDEIDWHNAPANQNGPAELDLEKVMMVGQIHVSPFDEVSIKQVSGSALRRFIESDTNKILTFIVVCETREKGNMGIAYGFANRNHPELPPPTLRFFQNDSETDDLDDGFPMEEEDDSMNH